MKNPKFLLRFPMLFGGLPPTAAVLGGDHPASGTRLAEVYAYNKTAVDSFDP